MLCDGVDRPARHARSAREVFGHIQKLISASSIATQSGRLVTRATNDVENVAEMFSAGIVALITDLLKMIGFAIDALPRGREARTLRRSLVVPLLIVVAVVFRLRVRDAFRWCGCGSRASMRTIQENHHRHEGGAALHTRETQPRRVRCSRMRTHRDACPALDPLRLGALLVRGARAGISRSRSSSG